MSELSVKAILGLITAAVTLLVTIGGGLLWASSNMVFASDLDQRMKQEITPIYGELKKIRDDNLESKILDLTAEIAVLEYNKENSEWTGADEVKLVTLLKQREQLEEKLKEKEE